MFSSANKEIGIAITLAVVLLGGGAQAQDTDAMLTAHMDAFNSYMPPNFDVQALSELYVEDGVSITPFDDRDTDLVGRKAILEGFVFFEAVFLEWTHVEERRIIEGGLAYWEGKAKGLDKATQKPIEIPMAIAYEFDEQGKVISEKVYYNPSQIKAQLEE